MDWRQRVLEIVPTAKLDEPMSAHTTFKIGGPADAYAEAATVEQARALAELGVPTFYVGWGSNLLVRDGGIRGLVVRLRGDFERLDFLGGGRVRAGAGLRCPAFVTAAAERGLGGAEFLVGVPGTIGGALVMNAGTREGEIGELVESVETLDGPLGRERLRFSYRSSNLQNSVVLGAILALKAGDKAVIMKRVQQHQQKRLQTQPVHTYNVGSTFKNPPGHFVAKLIEEAGLKGSAAGGARISPMHANFIENFNGAKATDVLALVERAKAAVKSRAGIELELEMKVVGEP